MADSVVTLRPNALISNGARNTTVVNEGGSTANATTEIQALADTNEGTGGSGNGKNARVDVTWAGWVYCSFPTPSIPAGSTITGCVGRLAVGATNTNSTLETLLWDGQVGDHFNTNDYFFPVSLNATNPPTQYTTHRYAPSTYDWSQIYLGARNFGTNTAGATTNNGIFQFYSFYLDVYYNAVPVPAVQVIGISSGLITTTTPTFTFTYTDAENDPILRTELAVYEESTALALGFSPFITTPIWTGSQQGALGGMTVTGNTLSAGKQYRVYIRMSDLVQQDGSYRWSTYDSSGPYTVFRITSNPLQEGRTAIANLTYDPAVGSVGPMVARFYPNIVYSLDADFETPVSGSGSTSGWVIHPSSGGVGTAASMAVVNAAGFNGNYFGRVTANALLPTFVGALNNHIRPNAATNQYAVTPGQLLMLLGHLKAVTTSRVVDVGVRFYTDDTFATQVGAACAVSHQEAANTTWTQYGLWTRVPPTAAAMRIEWLLNPASQSSEQHSTDGWTVQPWGLNVLTNAGLDQTTGSPPTPNFWTRSVTGTGTSTLMQAPTPSTTAGWTDGSNIIDLVTVGTSNRGQMFTTYKRVVDGTKWILSANVRYVNDFAAAPTTGSVDLFVQGSDNSEIPSSNTISGLPANTWTRVSQVIDTSATATTITVSPFIRATFTGLAKMHVQATDIMLEPIWSFVNGTCTGSGNLPSGNCFGETVSTSAGGTGMTIAKQDWFAYDDVSGSSVAYNATEGRSAGNCIKWSISAGNTADHGVAQYFTVTGMTSVNIDFWMKYTTAKVAATINWYDSSGYPLIDGTETGSYPMLTINPSATQSSFVNTVVPTLTVPARASYAQIKFNVVGNGTDAATGWLDDVTVTLNGSYASSDFVRGGYQTGGPGAFPSSQTEIDVKMQRSTNLATWHDMIGADGTRNYQRVQDGSTLNTSPWSSSYTDNEFDIQPQGSTPTTIYYRTLATFGDPAGSTASVASLASPIMPYTGSFAVNDWWLIDPNRLLVTTSPYGIKLQVKKFHSETQEQAGIYTGIGRNRKVIVSDVVLGETITLELQTITSADYNLLNAFLEANRTFLLRSPDGIQWWVRAVKRTRDRVWTGSYARPLRTMQVMFEEVDQVP